MTMSLTGDKALDRKFRRLADRAARKVLAQGIRAGLRVIAKGIKAEIPPHMKDAKKAIGSRLKKDKSGEISAKVGAGVGKKKKPTGARGGKPGVGISRQNIHWLLRGTRNRHHKTGKATGSTAPMPAVRLGYAKSKAGAMQKIIDTVRKGIAREASKK